MPTRALLALAAGTLALSAAAAIAAPGQLDPGFGTSGKVIPARTLNALAVRRDGRIVVGGAIVAGGLAACRGHDDSALARYRGG